VRILFLSDRYPPHYLGGYEIGCQAVVDGLRARGHETRVLASRFGVEAGPTPVERHVRRLFHRPQAIVSLARLAVAEIGDGRRLRREIEGFRPDVVYAWCLAQLFPSIHARLKAAPVPVVYAIQDLWIPPHLLGEDARRAAWLRPGSTAAKDAVKRVLRASFRRVDPAWLRPLTVSDVSLDHVVFCSEYQRQRHLAAHLPLGDSVVVPNAVDVGRFDGPPRRPGGDARLLFVGRLVEEKGAHLAIDALEELRRRGWDRLTLDVAGVPSYPLDYARALEAVVARRGLQEVVRFLGFVPAEGLPQVYRDHDVLVFPSRHLEGLPLTLIEAMASGLAVVATTAGGNREFLRDGVNSRTLSPEADGAAIADGLAELLADPPGAEALASAGREWARRTCSVERVARETEAYLETVAAGS
jgi:glycosyltransferase involved in cell wall biosynthesis